MSAATTGPVGDEPRVPRQPDRVELRREAQAQFWRRIAVSALVAWVILMLVASTWTLYLIRDSQVRNKTTLSSASAAARAAQRGTARIEDCTTPGGACFERAQRQTSGAVAGINTVTVRATACLAVVLKGIPEGAQVNVDDIASQIQQCIRTTTAAVKPQRVIPGPTLTPRRHRPPKGPAPSGAQPPTAPAPPLSPASPVPTAIPAPSPSITGDLLTELTCRLAPLLCR